MKKLAKTVVSNAAYLAKGWRVGPVQGRILMYHRVDNVPGDRLAVSPAAFRAQMDWLRRKQIRVVDLNTLIDSLHNPHAPANQVAITFDDGYLDNYEHAWPTLRSFGFTATIFVSAGLIGTKRVIPAERSGAVPAPLLSWEQVRELSENHIEIGSHAMTHTRLTRMPLVKVREEVTDSKKILEDRLGRPVEWFCYPSGAFSVEVVKLVQLAGYAGACSVRPGANTRQTNRFALRRTEVSAEDTLWTFQKKMAGAYDGWHSAVQGYQRWRRKSEQRKKAAPARCAGT